MACVIALQGLLVQFSHPQVRADFVNGKFGAGLDTTILPALDEVRWTLFPQWRGGAIHSPPRSCSDAGREMLKLFAESEEYFKHETEAFKPCTYREWCRKLELISTNNYWNVTPLTRSASSC